MSARKGYASPRGRTASERKRDEEAKRARDAKRSVANNTSPELREALGTPLQQSGLTFSVQAAPFKHNQKEASVALAIELDGQRLEFAQDSAGLFANNLELSFFGINEDGLARRATRSELNLTLRPETYKRVKTSGLRANPRLTLEPGRYQIRIGVRDSVAKQVGTVFYDLHVPDFRKDPLMLSGLLITASSAHNAMTAQPDPATGKLLPGPAMARRTFGPGDTLTVFAEIYDNMAAKQAHQVEASVTLTSEDGKEVFSARDSLANPAGADHWAVYALTRDVPLKTVPPGRYLLNVEAQTRGGNNNAGALRETLITITR